MIWQECGHIFETKNMHLYSYSNSRSMKFHMNTDIGEKELKQKNIIDDAEVVKN